MAKRRKVQLNWNGLTVDDMHGIIRHFAECEQRYTADLEECRAMPSTTMHHQYLEKSIRIVQARQVFWTEMIVVKERGEKIAPHVRQQVLYSRTSGEFNS